MAGEDLPQSLLATGSGECLRRWVRRVRCRSEEQVSRTHTAGRSSRMGIALLFASMATVPAAMAQEVTIRWGNASGASVPHALSGLLDLDPEVQKKHNIKVEFVDFKGNSSNCVAALIGNSVDFCQTGIASGHYAIAEGADLKSFAMLGGQVGEIVVNKAAADKAGLKLDAPVNERLAALKGMQIVGSGPGTPNYMLLNAMMGEAGLTVNDLQFRTLVDIAAMNEGIRNGAIDGAFWSVGGLAPVQADGAAVQVLSLARGDIPKFKDIALTAIFANTAWLDANRAAAKNVKEALKEVLTKFKADPTGYSAAYKQKYLEAVPEGTWKAIVDQNLAAYFPDVTGTAAGWDFWIDIMKAEGKAGADKASFANAFVNVD
jgi:ABC-type nitrate/sulfonate/bicarbonate transport system substrate-binding protein